jgi:Transglutaminase-like superfamily
LLYSAPLLGGDEGTAQTISMLRSLVDDGWKDPVVNRTAIEVIRNAGVQPYDAWGQIRAIYNFARSFYFVNDPVTKEALRPTRELLELMAGDCDDINGNVLPALLGTIGYETRLVTVAADRNFPEQFSHVYAEVCVEDKWYPLDAARPGAIFGMAPQYFFRRAWWSLIDDSRGDYPASAPDGATAGYARCGVRGLDGDANPGNWSGIFSVLAQDASGILKSVSGHPVQPVVGSTIGPGGAMSLPQTSFGAPSSTGIPTWVWLVGAGLLAWKFL